MKYQVNKIEKKWQKYWEDNHTFEVKEDKDKDKFYGLVEFPFPSGNGLHTGHLRSYTAMDIICRKKRMEGFNVLFPMGMDAFGLPAENYAIKVNIHPQITTRKNIDNFVRQLKETGFAFDWSRFIETTDPKYYKWTQWIFTQMFKKGLAYKASENINWCTVCKIGLANEEVVAGTCERCGSEVVKKEKEQWMLKITDYADRLIEDLDNIDFLDTIKKQQSDWIGKSQGAEIKFKVKSEKVKSELVVFTTRPDTLFGVTFMVLAPEHPALGKLDIKNKAEIKEYIERAAKKTDIERANENKEKVGVKLQGVKVINPVNNEEIPIFVADYVMMSYGTGAIMAVPAHDERDFAFAKKYNIEIKEVISGGDIAKEAYTDTKEGKMLNSGEYNGLSVKDFQIQIVKWLENKKIAKATVNYKLHDWIFSRQRYWGEPIPMVNCDKCGWQAVDEKDLPIILPEVDDFKPGDEGESPLAKAEDWINTTCPKCSGPAKRETDVMPNWAGSNWYFVRYLDPHNDKELISKEIADYWLPVDWYNGGMEHTTLHLLYSRFVYKFLADINVVPKHKDISDEPYRKRTAQGMILGEGGIKMSKSKGNVINPDGYLEKYGADTLRVYEMFMGPFNQSIPWDDKGVTGAYRFLNKMWDLQSKLSDVEVNKDIYNLLHKSIKKVGEDIDAMRFNTAISQLMILVNLLDKQSEISKDIFQKLILILAPFAPHIAEEMWQTLGHKETLANEAWPVYDEKLIKDEKVIIGIQVNGKVRDEIELDFDTEPSEELQLEILAREKVSRNIEGKKVVKFIHIKNKIISVVVK